MWKGLKMKILAYQVLKAQVLIRRFLLYVVAVVVSFFFILFTPVLFFIVKSDVCKWIFAPNLYGIKLFEHSSLHLCLKDTLVSLVVVLNLVDCAMESSVLLIDFASSLICFFACGLIVEQEGFTWVENQNRRRLWSRSRKNSSLKV